MYAFLSLSPPSVHPSVHTHCSSLLLCSVLLEHTFSKQREKYSLNCCLLFLSLFHHCMPSHTDLFHFRWPLSLSLSLQTYTHQQSFSLIVYNVTVFLSFRISTTKHPHMMMTLTKFRIKASGSESSRPVSDRFSLIHCLVFQGIVIKAQEMRQQGTRALSIHLPVILPPPHDGFRCNPRLTCVSSAYSLTHSVYVSESGCAPSSRLNK